MLWVIILALLEISSLAGAAVSVYTGEPAWGTYFVLLALYLKSSRLKE